MFACRKSGKYRACPLMVLIGAVFILFLASPGLAATRTWTGTASADWSGDGVGGNWNDEAAPVADDIVNYDSNSTANLSQNNDIAGLSLGGIRLQGSLANDVTIGGNALTMTGNISDYMSGQNLTINNNITLGSGMVVSSWSANQITLNGDITNNGNNLTYSANTAGGVFNLNGSISGTGGFDCGSTNGATCIVSAAQNYTGTTRMLFNATLQLSGAGDLPDNGYVILNNADSALDLNGISETIGSLAGSGPVLLGGATLTTGGDNSASMNISGVISGNGHIVKEGTGILMLGGANTFNGSLTINNGSVYVSSAAERIPDNASIILNAGIFSTGGFEETIGSLEGAAGSQVWLGGTATLTTGGNNASTTFAGTMIYGGGLTKEGTGTFTISGANTYTGATTINNGTLRLGGNDRLPNAGAVIVGAGATFDLNGFNETIASLSGSGTVNTGAGVLAIITALSPGTSPGIITLGNFTLYGTLNQEIDGANPGTGYDQIIATGNVTLAGNLNLTATHSPTVGTTFTIINKTSAGLPAGTFTGLAEGATISAGGTKYKISYAGGDGNDVTLTALASSGGGGGTTPEPEPDPDVEPRPAPNVSPEASPSPTGSTGGPVISWPKVGGTNHYNIYRAACPTCPKTQVGRVPGTSFTDETALPGQVYYYFVRSDNGALSDYSDWIPAWRYEQNPGRAGDFNGDGVADLLWWDPDTGQISIWFMNSGAVQSVSAPFDGLDLSQWLLVNTGDFNNDGIWDLLWWNPETGAAAIWYMAATASASMGIQDTNQAGDITGNVTLSYAGDLNADGRADLVWRDYATGDVTVWLMGEDGTPALHGPPSFAEGAGGVGDEGRPGLTGSLEWTLRGLYDMNGDKKADVVWQHASNGRVVVWIMDGAQAVGYSEYQRTPPDNWRVAGLGDLNADGRGDIVWRNDASGAVQAWLMTGAEPAYEERDLAMGDEAALWQVKAVGDFCAPGCDDVYCKQSETGAVKIMTLDGREFTPAVE